MRGGIPIDEYSRVHKELALKYGKASRCEHCEMPNKKRYEWALKTGRSYISDANNFLQLCTHCHRKYDGQTGPGSNKKIGEVLKGRPARNKKPIIRISDTGVETAYDSIEEAAKINNISDSSIWQVLSGNQKTGCGYKWKYQSATNL